MAGSTVSPEKVKNLLTSFLVNSNNRRDSISNQSRRDAGESRGNGVTTIAQATTASPAKSAGTSTLRSYDSFLKRLDTFSALTWFGKPAEVSPLICARYGWENVDTDMLQCASCKNFLCGKLPMKTDSKAYAESLEKLQSNIIASHDKFCVLATYPCPERFCQIPLDDPATLSADFSDRVNCLNKIQDRLPKLEKLSLEPLGYDEGQVGAYCKRHLMPDSDFDVKAVTLAVTGWTCSPEKDVLICSMCRRQIGLWNFAPTSPRSPTAPLDLSLPSVLLEDDDDNNSGKPAAKKRKISPSIKQEMNPVEEHHHWCPWVKLLPSFSSSAVSSISPPSKTSASQNATAAISSHSSSPAQERRTESINQQQTSSAPAFIAALKVIAPGLMDNNTGLATTMKKSPMIEGLRCIRRVIKTWSSPKARAEATSPS